MIKTKTATKTAIGGKAGKPITLELITSNLCPGKDLITLSNALHLDYKRVAKFCHDNKIYIPGSSYPDPVDRNQLFIDLYKTSLPDMCNKYNLSMKHMKKRLLDNGIDPILKVVTEYVTINRQRLEKYYQNIAIDDIAKKYYTYPNAIKGQLYRWGLFGKRRVCTSKYTDNASLPSIQRIHKDYNNGMSIAKITEKYNVNIYWARKCITDPEGAIQRMRKEQADKKALALLQKETSTIKFKSPKTFDERAEQLNIPKSVNINTSKLHRTNINVTNSSKIDLHKPASTLVKSKSSTFSPMQIKNIEILADKNWNIKAIAEAMNCDEQAIRDHFNEVNSFQHEVDELISVITPELVAYFEHKNISSAAEIAKQLKANVHCVETVLHML